MPIDQQELARRLKAARERVGVTQDQAAAVVGIPRPSVAQIEAGKRSVSGLELDRLARLYRRDVGDLLGPSSSPGDLVAHLRSETGLVDLPEVLDAIADCLRFGRELAALERLAGVDRTPTATYDLGAPTSINAAITQGAQAAEAERRRLGLGEAPVEDVVDLLEANGVRTAAIDMPDAISGLMLVEAEAGPLVVANRSHYAMRRTFSFAHEYAHVLLDRSSRGLVTRVDGSRDLREIRANAFAGALLMPEAGMRRRLAELGKATQDRPTAEGDPEGTPTAGRSAVTVRLHDVALLAHDFKVTRLAMLNRLRAIRAITQREFEELRDADARSGRGVARLLGLIEPDHAGERDRFGRRFARLALEAHGRGSIDREELLVHLTRHAGLAPEEAAAAVDETSRPKA
jgi:Zn-dependent peptidase ImmA (M78 family)/DNA-binding XRE family transcriptional regulator